MMIIIDVVNYILGYSEIEITGVYCEKFLTKAMHDNLCIWAIQRVDACTLRAKCRMVDMKTMEEACAASGTEIKVLEQKGVPLFLKKYKYRYGFAAGLVVFLAFLFIMSSFIWSIEITGITDYQDKTLVMQILEENGFHVGAPVFLQDYQELKREVMRQVDDVAYVTINVLGSKAEVEVRHRVPVPERLGTEPCNLVAEEDGQIVTIETYQGVPAVQKYDTVKKGQLLVGGIFDSKRIGYRLVHANAKIEARVLKKLNVFVPYEQVERSDTGKTKSYAYITIFGHRFNLTFHADSPYDVYEQEETQTDVTLSEDVVLPISFGTVTYKEQQEENVVLSEEEALQKGLDELAKQERMQIKNMTVEQRAQTIIYSSGGVFCEYGYTVIKDIAQQLQIYEEEKN